MAAGQTSHTVLFQDSRNLNKIPDQSVDLVVTSPPYPMIEMWDHLFGQLNPEISELLSQEMGTEAFELMHRELDRTWDKLPRIMKDGGYICINIGDATRTLNGRFMEYSSHSRIIEHFAGKGFDVLPHIIWKKETNSPNKFMGSGMLPSGAYVTNEHEFILIFRNGGKREFSDEMKRTRRESAYFWEERNSWFTDIWNDIKGVKQSFTGSKSRERSGAFPLELAYRLVCMFSIKGDIVLDPFLGTGTTLLAAAASERNSIGFEMDASLEDIISNRILNSKTQINDLLSQRISRHSEFVAKRELSDSFNYLNRFLGLKVTEKNEQYIKINYLKNIAKSDQPCSFITTYETNDLKE